MVELTLCMIVKNEESTLKRCLDSVKSIVDEYVIVDTGSTDGTLKIAEAYKAKILHFDWINDFSAARNFALKNSTGNWILYLDADEVLNSSALLEVQRIMKTNEKEAYLCILNSIDDYSGRPYIAKYPRLFRNNEALKFEGKVHEQIEGSLKSLNYKFVDSTIEILHYGYNISEEEKKEKAKRNLNLLLEEYKSNKSGYYAFQLGQTYSILNDKMNAAHYFDEALKDEKLNSEYKSLSYLFLANQKFREHKLQEAYEIIQNALRYGITQPSVNLLASKIAYKLNIIDEPILFCKKAFEFNQAKSHVKDLSQLDVLLNPEEIIYHGLYISITSKDQENIDFFQKKLFAYWEGKSKSLSGTYIRIFRKLINNYELDINDQKKITDIVNDFSIDIFLHLMNNYSITDIKINLFCTLYPKFKEDGSFLTSFAISLNSVNKTNEAIKLLESAIELEYKDPSAYFYLISLYLNNSKIEKISLIIEKAEKEFSHIPEVKSRLQVLTQKLQPYLKVPVNS